jgi:hypothetical protein
LKKKKSYFLLNMNMHSQREKSLFLYNILSTQKASLEHKIYTAYSFYTHKVRENPTLPWGNAY